MYMSEVSKSKISDLKAQKIFILWTLKHVSAINKHLVFAKGLLWNLSRSCRINNVKRHPKKALVLDYIYLHQQAI